jgi:2-polyprenyl-6-methoxyphenol hydroxylase-like FAD-dependent oxidoreductase
VFVSEEARERLTVVVVGGSLVGLAAAVALGRAGLRVEVYERSAGLLAEHGSGLGVDLRLLERLLADGTASALPVIRSPGRTSASWRGVYELLRGRAEGTAGVTCHDGVAVTDFAPSDEGVVVETSDRGMLAADVVVGADGYRSLVRRHIDHDRPDAQYAGYLLWRGVLDEREILRAPGIGRRAVTVALDRGLRVMTEGGRYLVTYPMPGVSGDTGPGERRLSWNWYWTASDGRLPWPPGSRPRTILSGDLDPEAAAGVVEAAGVWPEPWPALMELTARRRGLFANAIYEYLPRRLVRQRAVIIGDAAHVVSPMTGAGLINGFQDALALAGQLAGARGPMVPDALRRYERQRLGPARELAGHSAAWSHRFRSGGEW